MAKKKKIEIIRPTRDADHYSKRGCPYWWAPEWVRGTSADYRQQEEPQFPQPSMIRGDDGSFITPCDSYGKIKAVKDGNNEVNLYSKSKAGKYTYIQGSIQDEFQRWHTDRSIDYLLLGIPLDELIDDES